MGRHLAALFLSLIISPLFVFSSEINQIVSDQHLVNDLEAAKLRISQLEAVLEATIEKVDAKNPYLKELEKLIQDAETQILDLQSASYNVEGDLPLVQKRISELEEEVKLLWAALRTINFELHVSENKARESEDKVKDTALEVEQMNEVVTEQWIQIQHLEQMREFNNRRRQPSKCTFLKFMRDLYWEGKNVFLVAHSCLSQAMSQLKSLWEAVTKYHHQLQGFIKNEMERNEITATLANKEVVFFMASALITFPVFGAYIFLSS